VAQAAAAPEPAESAVAAGSELAEVDLQSDASESAPIGLSDADADEEETLITEHEDLVRVAELTVPKSADPEVFTLFGSHDPVGSDIDDLSIDLGDEDDALVSYDDEVLLSIDSNDALVSFGAAVETEAEPASFGAEEDVSSFVSIEEPSDSGVRFVSYDDDGNVDEDEPELVLASASSTDDVSAYITWSDDSEFDDSVNADAEGLQEVVIEDVEDTLIIDEEMSETLSDVLEVGGDDDEVISAADADADTDADALDVLDAELFEDEDDALETAPFELPPDTGSSFDDDEAFGDFEDDEVTFIADIGDLERLRQQIPAGSSTASVALPSGGAAIRVGAPAVKLGRPVTAGLYGGPSLPTIRDGHESRPRAAAVQINAATGTGKVIGLEEEDEPIAIGDIGDYEDEDDYDYDSDADSEGGFRVSLQEYDEVEDDEYEYEDEDEDEDEDEPPAVEPPPVVGPSPDEIRAIFESAEQAAVSGDMQVGAELYSDVLDLDPDHHRAHVGRGRLYLDLGDYTRAMSDFMLAEDIAPSDPEPQIAIGDLFFARKDYRKAIMHFNRALDVAPDHAMAFCRRGISHYYRKNYPQAMEDLMRARQLDEDIPNIATYIKMAENKAKR
jgi:tetratricopeptide (TPR) repeat protein